MNKPKVSVKISYKAPVKCSLHGFLPYQLTDLTFGSITLTFHVEVGELSPVNSNALGLFII